MKMDAEGLRTRSEELGAVWKGPEGKSGCRLDVSPDRLVELVGTLFQDKSFWFDFLVSISGEHVVGTDEKIRMHYHLHSIPFGQDLHLVTEVPVTEDVPVPVVPSLTGFYKSANWLERETAELFGVRFEGHPDLRNLLLPADWEGFPLRKNFVEATSYRSVQIAYGDKAAPTDIPKVV
jgi:NADH-quinone oxidoreductase subunit C